MAPQTERGAVTSLVSRCIISSILFRWYPAPDDMIERCQTLGCMLTTHKACEEAIGDEIQRHGKTE